MEFDLMTKRKITPTGYNRPYASWLLKDTGKRVRFALLFKETWS